MNRAGAQDVIQQGSLGGVIVQDRPNPPVTATDGFFPSHYDASKVILYHGVKRQGEERRQELNANKLAPVPIDIEMLLQNRTQDQVGDATIAKQPLQLGGAAEILEPVRLNLIPEE